MQGQTKRWAVAWSFRGSRLPDAVARGVPAVAPPSTERVLRAARLVDVDGAPCTLRAFLASLTSLPENAVAMRGADEHLALDLYSACWTRGARRKRARHEHDAAEGATRGACPRPVLAVDVARDAGALRVRWTYGMERVLFESFAVHLFGEVGRRLSSTACGARAHR